MFDGEEDHFIVRFCQHQVTLIYTKRWHVSPVFTFDTGGRPKTRTIRECEKVLFVNVSSHYHSLWILCLRDRSLITGEGGGEVTLYSYKKGGRTNSNHAKKGEGSHNVLR